MNNKVFITFVVPCYNQASFLKESLATVINQTCKQWVCIIVNDGSTDNTKNEALSWVKKDSRFKYLEKQNGGLSSARNLGIKHAETEYIFPLDADDKLDITYLEKAIKILSKNKDIEVLTSRVKLFGVKMEEFILPEYKFETLLLRNCFIACSIFKKETFNRIGGYDENLSSFEDWDFWISVLKDGGKHYKINEMLYHYRKHEENSLSNRFYHEKNYYKHLHDYIYNKHIKLYQKYFPNFIFVYQDYLLLKAFSDKVKNDFIFKVYIKIKKMLIK